MQQEDIVNRFTYHPPFGNQAERYAIIREWALNFALKINELTPASREQSLAITELENCVAHANAAIARNERQAEGSSSQPPGLPEGVIYADLSSHEGTYPPGSE